MYLLAVRICKRLNEKVEIGMVFVDVLTQLCDYFSVVPLGLTVGLRVKYCSRQLFET